MSTLKERINNDMKTALLGGNHFAGNVLRNLKASILDEEIAKNARQDGLSDEGVEIVIAREIKKRTESAKIYNENNRQDLADAEENEIDILKPYLPKQLSEDELQDIVSKKIIEINATDIKQMGTVISAVKASVGNKADGALLASIVKKMLNS